MRPVLHGGPEPDAPAAPAPALGRLRALASPRAAELYARTALAAAFLSAVASRFGLWSGRGVEESFARFVAYTAQVNAFLPASLAPALAGAATVAELTLGVLLLVGWRLRAVALGSAGLLALFGAAMAASFGPKEPLDASVFSASAAAMLLALRAPAQARRPLAARPRRPGSAFSWELL